jgi:hypothetical protein
MKYLALTTAALFLFAAPGAFAQNNDNNNNNPDTGGNNVGATQDNSGAGGNDATGSTSNQGGPDCPTPAAGQAFDSFSPACQAEINIWMDKQAAASVPFEGDVAVGVVVPDTVEVIEVPAYRNYGYVMLNDRRVLVDRDTRTVVRVY